MDLLPSISSRLSAGRPSPLTLALLVFLGGCSGASDSGVVGDSASASASDSDSGSTLGCPADMVPIGPSDDGGFCLDTWEGKIEGDPGAFDQYAEPSGDAIVVSAEGETLVLQLSFGQAKAACERTPILAADGEVLGWKRLARSAEWQDGIDGVWGDGGARYPYGESYDPEPCGTPDGEPTASGLSTTGSYPDCVSAFGTWEQIGNAWEWSDPEFSVSLSGWLDLAREAGLDAEIDADNHLRLAERDLLQIWLELSPYADLPLYLDDEGRLSADINLSGEPERDRHVGYVFLYTVHDSGSTSMLPVEVTPDADGQYSGPLLVAVDFDGTPVADKRGCAWYTGDADTCSSEAWNYTHPHNFFADSVPRCAADPVPEERL